MFPFVQALFVATLERVHSQPLSGYETMVAMSLRHSVWPLDAMQRDLTPVASFPVSTETIQYRSSLFHGCTWSHQKL
jgi:hypothetical protein